MYLRHSRISKDGKTHVYWRLVRSVRVGRRVRQQTVAMLGELDAVWSPTTFSKNRERLIDAAIADKFFERVQDLAREAGLRSDEHFTLDGTLIEAWAGHKSFKPKDAADDDSDDPGNPTLDFHGEKRANDTHQSTTDPQARLYRKSNGIESKLCFAGHVMMDNRHGLAVDNRLTEATGRCEREAGLAMAEALSRGRKTTIGGDKGYDTKDFVEGLRELGITPHIAPPRSRDQPKEEETNRRDLRLAQDGRTAPEDTSSRQASRRMDVSLRPGGVQPRPNADPRVGHRVKSGRVTLAGAAKAADAPARATANNA